MDPSIATRLSLALTSVNYITHIKWNADKSEVERFKKAILVAHRALFNGNPTEEHLQELRDAATPFLIDPDNPPNMREL